MNLTDMDKQFVALALFMIALVLGWLICTLELKRLENERT